MRYIIPVLLLITACNFINPKKKTLAYLEGELNYIKESADGQTAQQRADELWTFLRGSNSIPFAEGETVIFLYKGDAESVSWNGDFNSWGGDQRKTLTGIRVNDTDLWYHKTEFPSDSRLDYKVTINENDWILDPENPQQQWSGFGPNSELRMPDWKAEPMIEKDPEVNEGLLWESVIIESDALGYPVSYQVYVPFGYENFEDLNVIYTTDGQEYSDDNLGAMVTVLDNLHHQNLIKPTIAVFVSPLDPENPDFNRRAEEMGNNVDYISFFVGELIPKVEAEYKTSGQRDQRAILGTSLGGLNATYFAFTRPDIFQKAAIQAPAYWFREEIYDIVEASNFNDPDIFMSVGTIGDNTEVTREMKKLFEKKGLEFTYLEVNEGHSWGAWSAQVDDILIQFFGSE